MKRIQSGSIYLHLILILCICPILLGHIIYERKSRIGRNGDGEKVVEIFRTDCKPPAHGTGDREINQFLYNCDRFGMNRRRPIRPPYNGTGIGHQSRRTTVSPVVSTTKSLTTTPRVNPTAATTTQRTTQPTTSPRTTTLTRFTTTTPRAPVEPTVEADPRNRFSEEEHHGDNGGDNGGDNNGDDYDPNPSVNDRDDGVPEYEDPGSVENGGDNGDDDGENSGDGEFNSDDRTKYDRNSGEYEYKDDRNSGEDEYKNDQNSDEDEMMM